MIDTRIFYLLLCRVETYRAKFSNLDPVLFDYVMLPQKLINVTILNNQLLPVIKVLKLTKYTRLNIKEVLAFFTGKHRDNVCYNGAFSMDDILFENGIVRLCDGIVEVGFYDRGCSLDYLKLHGILSLLKTVDGYYAQYF